MSKNVKVIVKTLTDMFEVEYFQGAGISGLKSAINTLCPSYYSECQVIAPVNFEKVEEYSYYKANDGDVFFLTLDTVINCVTIQLPFELDYHLVKMSNALKKMKSDKYNDRQFMNLLDNHDYPDNILAKLYNLRWKSSYDDGTRGFASIIYHPSYGVTMDQFLGDTYKAYEEDSDAVSYWGIYDGDKIWFPTFRDLLQSDVLKKIRFPSIFSNDDFIDMIDDKIRKIVF